MLNRRQLLHPRTTLHNKPFPFPCITSLILSSWVPEVALAQLGISISHMDPRVSSWDLTRGVGADFWGSKGVKGLAREPYIFFLSCFASIGGVLFGYVDPDVTPRAPEVCANSPVFWVADMIRA